MDAFGTLPNLPGWGFSFEAPRLAGLLMELKKTRLLVTPSGTFTFFRDSGGQLFPTHWLKHLNRLPHFSSPAAAAASTTKGTILIVAENILQSRKLVLSHQGTSDVLKQSARLPVAVISLNLVVKGGS